MSCCSGGYCQFKFSEGPPLVDNPVTNLNAVYLFLPYGTLLAEGEVVRIWIESGKSKTVILEEKIPLVIAEDGPKMAAGIKSDLTPLPWQLIALDSGIEYEALLDWKHHPLHNPNEQAVLLKFNHPIEVQPSLKMWFLKLLYKLRNL